MNVFSGELLDILSEAEATDPTYQAALAAAQAVRGETALNRAGLLPSVSFQANIAGNRHDIDVAPGAFGLDGRQSFDSENFEFRAEQPLFRFDRWLKLKQVDERIAQAEAEVAAVHADLVMKVSERYLKVMGFRSEVANAQAELDALLAQMEQTLIRYDVGAATEADLLQAQADSDRAASELIKAQNNVDVALDSLFEILNRQVDIRSHLSNSLSLSSLENDDIEYWSELAKTQNASVLAAELQINIARYDRNIARSAHLPTVGLVGKYGFDSQGGRFGETDNTSGSIGVELQVPIFSGGAVVAQTNIAGHKITEAEFRADAARRDAERQAKEAFRRMITGIAQEKAARQSLRSSTAARDALAAQFDGGTRTIADLLDAEKNIYQAKRELSRSHQDYIINSLRLRVATGTLASSDILHIDSLLQAANEAMNEDESTGEPTEPPDKPNEI